MRKICIRIWHKIFILFVAFLWFHFVWQIINSTKSTNIYFAHTYSYTHTPFDLCHFLLWFLITFNFIFHFFVVHIGPLLLLLLLLLLLSWLSSSSSSSSSIWWCWLLLLLLTWVCCSCAILCCAVRVYATIILIIYVHARRDATEEWTECVCVQNRTVNMQWASHCYVRALVCLPNRQEIHWSVRSIEWKHIYHYVDVTFLCHNQCKCNSFMCCFFKQNVKNVILALLLRCMYVSNSM